MRQIRLFTRQPLAANTSVTLESEPAHHLVRVLRARVGDTVVLFNGEGLDWQCQLTQADKRHVIVHIVQCVPSTPESPLHTHLGLSVSKGERFDWAVQKATELGVAEITPLLSERVDVKLPGERLAKKLGHWQQVAIAACEQCGRGHIPRIYTPMALKDWVELVQADVKLVLHHHQIAPLPSATPTCIALLVGPEGGLTEAEVEAACVQGFQRFRMGPRVLRTETAPLVALAILGNHWGDL